MAIRATRRPDHHDQISIEKAIRLKPRLAIILAVIKQGESGSIAAQMRVLLRSASEAKNRGVSCNTVAMQRLGPIR
jgi:hypothetical protein